MTSDNGHSSIPLAQYLMLPTKRAGSFEGGEGGWPQKQIKCLKFFLKSRQTDRQLKRQEDRQTDRQTDSSTTTTAATM